MANVQKVEIQLNESLATGVGLGAALLAAVIPFVEFFEKAEDLSVAAGDKPLLDSEIVLEIYSQEDIVITGADLKELVKAYREFREFFASFTTKDST